MAHLRKLMKKLWLRSSQDESTSDDTNGQLSEETILYRNINYSVPYLFKAIIDKDMEQLQTILQTEGLDVDLVHPVCNSTALHTACEENNFEAVKLLVEHGCKVDVRQSDQDGTPLLTAACEGNINIIRYLLDHGADINCRGNQLVPGVVSSEATDDDDPDNTQEVTDSYELNTPLIQACREGHVEVVQELITRGCLINQQNQNGNTALHVACLGRTFYPYATAKSRYISSTFFGRLNSEIVRILLQHGASTTITNFTGHTPFDRIFQINHLPSLRLLGWGFTQEELNSRLIELFKILTVLIQYQCGGQMTTSNVSEGYKLMSFVSFAATCDLSEAVFPLINDLLLTGLSNGCTLDIHTLEKLEKADPRFRTVIAALHPVISNPQSLRSTCRIYLRHHLASIHHGLLVCCLRDQLSLPVALKYYLLGERLGCDEPTFS